MTKILVVDDQPCVRESLSDALISEGYQIATAGDAESVKGYLRSSRLDLVLLDLYLDGPDGFALLRDIKRQYPRLPVIIVTAYDTFMSDPRLSKADGYVIKGANFADLKKSIARVLGKQSVTRADNKRDLRSMRCETAP